MRKMIRSLSGIFFAIIICVGAVPNFADASPITDSESIEDIQFEDDLDVLLNDQISESSDQVESLSDQETDVVSGEFVISDTNETEYSYSFTYDSVNKVLSISGETFSHLVGDISDLIQEVRLYIGHYYWNISDVKIEKLVVIGNGVGDCSRLFSFLYGIKEVKEIDLSGFNTTNVTNMNCMFVSCSALTQLNLSGFNTANVTNMSNMFGSCSSLTQLDLSGFNTANVTDMSYMFVRCSSLTQLDLSDFNTANVTSMKSMFSSCGSLTQLDISGFNTANVTDMSSMFNSCSSLTQLDTSGFNTANVTDMSHMFNGCSSLTQLDLSSFDTQNVGVIGEGMAGMFRHCSSLPQLDISGFNTANVTDMSYMFDDCKSLKQLDISNFDTQNVEDMQGMFGSCSSLTQLDISGFNTANVTNMGVMFSGCESLKQLDLSNFDTRNVTYRKGVLIEDINWMLDDTKSLMVLYTPCYTSAEILLPYEMYDEQGNSYTSIPIMNGRSIKLIKDAEQATDEIHINYSGFAVKKVKLTDKKGNSILTPGTSVKYARSDERRGYRTETVDKNGAIYVKSNKYTYDPNGNNNHSFDTVITDLKGKELAKVSMDNIIVDNISFYESWEGKLGQKVEAGIGEGVGITLPFFDAEIGVADVKATLSRSAAMNVKNKYDKGLRSLEISQSYDARVGASGNAGPKASAINECIEISGISVDAEAGIGHQAVAGIKIPNYDPDNTDQNNKAGRAILLGIAESRGNVMLLEIFELLGYENTINTYKSKTTIDGSAGMDIMGFSNKFGDNENLKADISLASGRVKGIVSYEGTVDHSAVDKPATYTKTRKYTKSGEINILDTSVSALKKTDDIGYGVKSGFQLGFDLQDIGDFSVTADLNGKRDTSLNGEDDDVINKISYSTILYQPETVFDYTIYEKDNGEIKRETTYKDDAVLDIISDSKHTKNSNDIKSFYRGYFKSLSKDDYKYVDQYEANATYELKNTDRTRVGLTIPLEVQLEIKLGIGGEISGTYESSYSLESGDYVYNQTEKNKEYIPSSKTDSEIIEDNIEKVGFGASGFAKVLEKPMKAIVPDILAHIKDLSADKVGQNIKNKMASIIYSFDEDNPIGKLFLHLVSIVEQQESDNLGSGPDNDEEAQSYEIYTFPESDNVDALYSSEEGEVASTVGDPYIIYTTDEDGNEVDDWGGQTLRLELGYTNEMLEAAGAGLDDVSKLAVYEYSAEKLGYIYKGGEVDTINKKVFLDISEPGQYILAIDNAAPVVSVFTTDGKNPPTIICTIDDMTDLSEYSMTLDGNEIVNTENIKNYFDIETQSVYYPVTEKLSIGDHIATVYASDAQGNSMESPIELIINIKEEDDNSRYGDVLAVDIPSDGIIPDGIWIAGATDMAYTGKALTQDFRVYDGTTMLTPNTDYTVKYKNNKNAYSIADPSNLTANDKKKAPQILITMKGNYSGKETVYFSINPTGENPAKVDTKPYAITGDKIKITDETGNSTLSAEYNKAGAKPSIRVMYEDKVLKEGRDYTLKYSGNTTYPAAKASVTVTGKGNYTGKKIIPITITKRPFSKEAGITVVAADKSEGKKAGQYVTAVKVFDSEGKMLKAGTDYEKNIVYLKSGTELTKTDYPKAGDVITVRITGKGGYTDTFIEANYNILASGQVNDIGKATFKIKNQAYNKGKAITITSQDMFEQAFIGKNKAPLRLSTDGGETGDFVVVPGSYVKNTTKGTAKVTFMGINGKTGTKTVSFKIGVRSIKDIWYGMRK